MKGSSSPNSGGHDGASAKKSNLLPQTDDVRKHTLQQKSKFTKVNETSKSNRPKDRATSRIMGNASNISTSSASTTDSRSCTSNSRVAMSGKCQSKTKSNSSSRGRQKRKAKMVMAQIVKQVRRNKRSPGGKSGKAGKSSGSKQKGKLSASSGKVVSKVRSNSNRTKSRRKKTSRSLQQFHILEKSVFRSRLDSRNIGTEPIPYHWTKVEQANLIKMANIPCSIDRTNSECSLVGKSIVYRDDVGQSSNGGGGGSGGGKPIGTLMLVNDIIEPSSESECDLLSFDSIRDELSRCEADNIFEPGPFE
ncbi:hypothetical protein BLOT_006107 [Blomia tropicalis]|nr:hypothetical protein BLOT_006107 [Blomia tropicalis]